MLNVIPLSLAEANAFVTEFHRHHKAVRGHKFSVALADRRNQVRAVAIVGRPVARLLDDRRTVEVTRLCSNGAKNAASQLYGIAARVARELGYRRIVTYILESEPGTSLRAAGWELAKANVKAESWSRGDRPRVDKHPIVRKQRWERAL